MQTLVMLLFMWGMYKNRTANFAVLAISAVVFAGALWLVRSQETVGDVSYMKARIPHHSIAEMKQLIADLQARPVEGDSPGPKPVSAEQQ